MHLPRRQHRDGEENSYEEKTAEKETPGPEWGHLWEWPGVVSGEEEEGGWSLLVTLSSIYMRCAHRALGLFLQGLESH